MKLRTLQIKGFKSFGNETTIHFNDEIIGIVGPNGSGKSNIVDAIRWVLGEQKSKELRLDKMVDVIFNGTKSKRKAGMAMVSMTFENSKKLIPVEFDSVKISRILYDTNESEYRINDVPCRLKDVRDLFLDTGIGSNSYAIIELGMVDDILTDKDHSRRRMFEQAAGIAKYKVRKREAQLKLKNTQGDLDRVEDILFELESSMKSLERQARRTRRYYELKDEYKDLSIKKAILGQAEAIDKEASLKDELTKQKEALVSLTGQSSLLEAELESIKKSNLDSEQMLSARQKEFNAVMDSIRSAENRKEIGKQNLNFIRQNIDREERNLQQARDTITGLTEELESRRNRLASLEEERVILDRDFRQKKAHFEKIEETRKNVQGASNEQMAELKALEDRKFGIDKQIIEEKSRLSNLEHNRAGAVEELSKYREAVKSTSTTQEGLRTTISELKLQMDRLKEQKAGIETDRQRIADEVEHVRSELSARMRRLDALENEYKLLKDMVDSMEGFPESARFLVKKWDQKRPLLSDIIECPDDYRPAIEAYLEKYLSYFILENVGEARRSIELLRESQKGRAQFFILSSFADKISNTQLLYDHHGLPALEVVKTEPKYNALLHFLLENVVLVEDDEVLRSDALDEDVIYLSRSGSTNRTRHAISGGSIGLFDGKRIGRRKEIDKLKGSIEAVKKEINDIEKKQEDLKRKLTGLSASEYDAGISRLAEQIKQEELKYAETAARARTSDEAISHLEQRIESFNAQEEEGKQKIVALETSLGSVTLEIRDKRENIELQAGEVENITQEYARINAAYNEAHLKWVRHQNDYNNLLKEIDFRESQHADLTEKISQHVSELKRLETEITEGREEINAIEEKLVREYAVKKEKQAELNDTEQAFYANRKVITAKEEDLRKLHKDEQGLQLKINELKDELTGIEFSLQSAMERLRIEFNVDLKTLDRENYIVEDSDRDELEQKYEKIRNRLDNYGQINPLAVEAYDEIQQRYTVMVTQRDDIIEARTSLEATINEIDTDATGKFLESFEKVKENFKTVFRSLFSAEDDCDLVLFNPENPLESDIEIIAKPKGKRPKVLSQLSGGEKTLTATALLFSLYLLKPAPFCIFDEVDAPLDDVNIRKFSRLIRQFSNESQFIIITHNKSTMAALDLLYGVYMQEQGVSGITQVDFREYEHNEIFQNVNVGQN